MSRRRLPGGDDLPSGTSATEREATAPARPEIADETRPRIYVASLTDYNAGVLHGAWLTITDVPGLDEGIAAMLATSPTARRTGETAEEWRIDDYDGWGRCIEVGSFESLDTLVRVADGLTEHGPAYGAWVDVVGTTDNDALGDFEEHYLGEFADLEAFGDAQLDDLGFDPSDLPGVPEGLRPYVQVDIAGWVRDMELGGEICSREGGAGAYVFWTP